MRESLNLITSFTFPKLIYLSVALDGGSIKEVVFYFAVVFYLGYLFYYYKVFIIVACSGFLPFAA